MQKKNLTKQMFHLANCVTLSLSVANEPYPLSMNIFNHKLKQGDIVSKKKKHGPYQLIYW